MSATNGTPNGKAGAHAGTSPREDLRDLRLANRLAAERVRAARLKQIQAREERRAKLLESLSADWVTPYAELLNLTRQAGDPVLAGPTSMWQRRHGRNWPIYQTEQELNLLRAPARVLLATVGYAQGLVEGITSYLVGSGCTFRVAKADDRDDLPREVVAAAQDVVDGFLDRNQWYGGEQPGLEAELVGRSMEEGEWLLCHYFREDGSTDLRVQEPEALTQPPGTDFAEWGFGIYTPRDDAQDHRAYWFQHGDTPEQGEEYRPEEVTHFRRNVRRGMKRGLTDFCFDTYDSLYLAGRLRTNLGDTAAQQAAIVGVRQHESGSREDVQAFVDGDADLTEREPLTGNQLPTKFHRRGSWEDIPKGMNYVAGPIASSTPIHVQVLDACLRGAGQKWQAPPWLMSGDLNAMNYATSLTAENPFVRTILRNQRPYCEAFRRPAWAAFEHRVRTRGLRDRTGRVWSWEELEGRLKLMVTAPSPETRNKLEEAQRAATEIPLGVQSRQAYAQEQGRDWDRLAADNREYADQFGGDGAQLPLPGEGDDAGDGGGAGTADPFGRLSESLLESGFTGTVTDSAGRERHYVDGEQVAKNETGGKGDEKGKAGAHAGTHPMAASPPPAAAVDAAVAGVLPKGAPAGLVARVKAKVGAAMTRVAVLAYDAALYSPQILEAVGLIADTPEDMGKLGYNPATHGNEGQRVNDPLKDAAGLPITTHQAVNLVTKVLPAAVAWVKGKLGGGKRESLESRQTTPAELLHAMLAALAEEFGAPAPPPAAKIAELPGASRLESKDAAGHEHSAEDGKFTGSGGSGSGGGRQDGGAGAASEQKHAKARRALDAMGLAHDHLDDGEAEQLHDQIAKLHAKTKPPPAPGPPAAGGPEVDASEKALRDALDRDSKDPGPESAKAAGELLAKVRAEHTDDEIRELARRVTGKGGRTAKQALAFLQADLTAVTRAIDSQKV